MFFMKKVYFPFSMCKREDRGVLTALVVDWGLLALQLIVWLLSEMSNWRLLDIMKSKILW